MKKENKLIKFVNKWVMIIGVHGELDISDQ